MSATAREISENSSPKPNRLTAVPCREKAKAQDIAALDKQTVGDKISFISQLSKKPLTIKARNLGETLTALPGRVLKEILKAQSSASKKKGAKGSQKKGSAEIAADLNYSLKKTSSASDIEAYLEQEFKNIERSLFAPSYGRVCVSVLQATAKPVAGVGLVVAFFLLPGKSSLAVLSGPPQGAAGADVLASAFVEDHQAASAAFKNVPNAKKTSTRIIEETISPTEQVQLPLLREMGKPEERPLIVDQAAMKSAENDLTALTRVTPPKSAVNGDRRSLVKFISGLIAAFRPQLPDSSLIARHIVELSGSEHVDPLYVAAVIAIESRFSSTARSGVGATGLMQLMPMTAGEVAERYNLEWHAGKLTDPRANIRLGIRYLKELEQKYNGNRFLALSAYNWGPGNVDQAQGRERNIPGSVKKYSKTILDRTNSWRKHFAHANESAELIAELPQQPTHS